MKARVSVIVPVRNREHLIERCLDSIWKQKELPEELIVVDNGSTDGTFTRVKEWMASHSNSSLRMKLLEEEQAGACRARQKGLDNATEDYLIFFDSDDTMLPHLIRKVKSEIRMYPDSDIVCWKCRIHQLNGTVRIPPFMFKDPLEAHLIHTLLRPQGYMVAKDTIKRAGGWGKPVEVWNDFELGLRLLLQNPKISGIPEVMAEIYSQADSITGIDFSSKAGKWEATLKEMEEENLKSMHPQQQKIGRILRYRKAILAAHYTREHSHKYSVKLIKEALKGAFKKEKALLVFSYLYTGIGLRGAWRIVRFAY